MKIYALKKEIDLSKLDAEMDVFKETHTQEIKYLIMSQDTINNLQKDWEVRLTCIPKEKRFYFNSYKGIPIAVCNTLEFGEIEII